MIMQMRETRGAEGPIRGVHANKFSTTTANNNKTCCNSEPPFPSPLLHYMAFPYTIARMSTPSVQDIHVWWGEGGVEGGAARDCERMPQQTMR